MLRALVLASLALPVLLAFAHPSTDHPASLMGSEGNFGRYVASCLGHGLALCGIVWLSFRVLDRGELRGQGARLTAGTTAALVAVLGLVLHCPIASATHWLLGHAGIGFLALFASLVTLRWIRKS